MSEPPVVSKPFQKPRRNQTLRPERNPERMWLDYGECYVEVRDGRYVGTDADEFLVVDRGPDVLLQTTILRYGDRTDEGVIVASANKPWFEICKQIQREPG